MENLPNEIWKPVPNYEGLYEVSNMGRVKALEKTRVVGRDRGFRTYPEVIMTGTPSGRGYLRIKLCKHGKYRRVSIHSLVVHAFLGYTNSSDNMVIDHDDNDPANNKLSNLQIITNRENVTKDSDRGYSEYVGVHFKSKIRRWGVKICINRDQVHLGYFDCEIEASQHYKTAVKNIHLYAGDKAKFREEIKRLVSELK